jgi:hypothetical protein
MSKLEVDAIEPQSGTTLTIGASGDSVNIASGATITDFKSTGIDDNATSTAITIDSNENVGINGSPNNYAGYGNITLNGTSGGIFDLGVNGTRTGTLLALVTETRLSSITNIPLTFSTNNAERMRIDSSGNLGIGTSSPTAKLNVNGAIVGATKADSTPDNTDVSGVNSLTVSTGAGSQTINGLVGGVAGQVLHIIKTNSANTLTITHNNAGGTQKIFTSDTNSISLTNFGGVTLLFYNGNWYEVGK